MIFFNRRDSGITKLLLLTRLLRLLSLLTHIPKFSVIFTIYGSLVGLFSRVIGVLIGIYYIFSFIGIQLYGGKLFVGHVDLSGSLYASAQYFCYNFNDFPNAIVVMWNLQLLNNWNIMFDGVERVSTGASRIYFIVFWLFCVIVVANLMISFVLEAVVSEWQNLIENPAQRLNLLNEEELPSEIEQNDDDKEALSSEEENEEDIEKEMKSIYIERTKNISVYHVYKDD